LINDRFSIAAKPLINDLHGAPENRGLMIDQKRFFFSMRSIDII
jgi:hypothetical protein